MIFSVGVWNFNYELRFDRLQIWNFVEQGLVLRMLELLWTEIVELRRFQLKQVNLSSLGELYREGKDSCRVFILYMHIL